MNIYLSNMRIFAFTLLACTTVFGLSTAAEARSRYINLVVYNPSGVTVDVTLIPGSCFKGGIPYQFMGEDRISEGRASTTIRPNERRNIMLYRSQSSSCDGEQGYFTLAYADAYADFSNEGKNFLKREFSFSNNGRIQPFGNHNLVYCVSIDSEMIIDNRDLISPFDTEFFPCKRIPMTGDFGWALPDGLEPPQVHVPYRDELVSQYTYSLFWTGNGFTR